MARETRPYISYLLRLWQIKSRGSPVWRASLEDPHTGQRRGFASLEDLFDFLRGQTTTPLDVEEKEKAKRFETSPPHSGGGGVISERGAK